MDFLKKNKIIIGIVVVIIVVGLGVWYMMGKNGSAGSNGSSSDQTQNVKQISPEDIGLSVSVNNDGKSLDMSVDKLSGVKTLEYELSYDAAEADPDSGQISDVPKGVVASPVDVNGQSSIKRNILLGTCSANVCRYDKVKSDIKMVVKVTYSNGEVGSVELNIPYSAK